MNNLKTIAALVAALAVAPSVLAAAPTFQYKHTAKSVVVTPASSDTTTPPGTGGTTPEPVTPVQPPVDGEPAPIADPYRANVTSLLHLDGTAVDSTGKAASAPGVTYAKGKFGQAGVFGAGYVSGSNLYDLTNPTWTAEMWIHPTAVNGALMGQYLASDAQWFWTMGTDRMAFAGATFTFPNGIPLNMWHHVALVRNTGITTAYVDGVRSSTSTPNTITMRGTNVMFGSGWFGPRMSNPFNGMIDEIRLTGGVARYTTPTFTPPAGPSAN